MGVKSTTEITRAEAERRLVEHRLQAMRPQIEQCVRHYSDHDLEVVLEANLNDPFVNFLIVPDDETADD